MSDYRPKPDIPSDPKRRNFIFLGFLGCTGVLAGRLWYLQLLLGKDFSVASVKNRIREIIIPAPRGAIYDHEGQLFLGNRPFFDLIIIPQYLVEPEKTLAIVSDLFHISQKHLTDAINESRSNPKFVPIPIKRNLTLHEVATLESNKFFLPGVEVNSLPRRDYQGDESAHLFGYLGEVTLKELDILNSQVYGAPYRVGSIIGKTGIEKKYERYLKGEEGREALLVDAYGRLQANQNSYTTRSLSQVAKQGYDLYLTLDKDLQQVAASVFQEKNGAICAINPQTGAILAYHSHPNYKLSMYQQGLSGSDWQSLQTNPFKPLLDKVTGGAYPPGSTYKPIVALAALEEGVITPERQFVCPGYFNLGNGHWRCWNHKGHGPVNLTQALEKSCDVYFYNVGNMLGIDRIAKWGKLFGLGERTGLELNMELAGLAPTTEWKLHAKGMPWVNGDTVNCSIGQGFNLTTPLQMLNVYATLGNNGSLYRPRLLKKIVDSKGNVVAQEPPFLIRTINAKPENLALVKKGLFDVIQSPTGTAKKARVPGFTVSGKTGTAQTASLKITKGIAIDDVAFQNLDHAWFAGYSPSDNAQIAVIVFSEYDGGGGGANAAPIAQKIIEAFWRKQYPERFSKKEAFLLPKTKICLAYLKAKL